VGDSTTTKRQRIHAQTLCVSILLVIFPILSCSIKKSVPIEKSRIVFLHYFSGSLSGGIEELVSQFNESNPAYSLSAVPLDHESFKSSIGDTLSAGNPPDMYSYWAGAKTRDLSDRLANIDDVWAGSGLFEIFPKALSNSASVYAGNHYLLPLTQHAVGFFYNKALFARAGVEEPHSWDDFIAVCTKLKDHGILPIALGADVKWPAQFWFDYLLIRTAGVGFRNSLLDGRSRWTDPRVKKVFSLWRGLLEAGFFNEKPDTLTWDEGAARMVAEGEAAMTLMGTWIMGSWKEMGLNFKENSDYSFFPFPFISLGVPSCMLGPIDGIVIPKDAKNIEGAKQVLRFFASKEAQELMSRGSGALAPAIKVPATAYTATQNRIKQEIEKSEIWAFNYDLDTSIAASEIGLSLFVDFLRFPAKSDILLEAAQKRFSALSAVGKQ